MLKGNKVRRTESGADAHVAAQAAAAGGPGWREAVGMEPGRGIWVHREDRVRRVCEGGCGAKDRDAGRAERSPAHSCPQLLSLGAPGPEPLLAKEPDLRGTEITEHHKQACRDNLRPLALEIWQLRPREAHPLRGPSCPFLPICTGVGSSREDQHTVGLGSRWHPHLHPLLSQHQTRMSPQPAPSDCLPSGVMTNLTSLLKPWLWPDFST